MLTYCETASWAPFKDNFEVQTIIIFSEESVVFIKLFYSESAKYFPIANYRVIYSS